MSKNTVLEKSGFTLLELAIVLTIIGLVVGGITVGSSMIRGAEIRSVISDYQKYKSSIYAFKEQYAGFPGDLNNATRFWGPATVCPGDHTTPSTDGTTCNGDGDGSVDLVEESWRGWQHLANSGLIEGAYTGVPNSAAAASQPAFGVNLPASKVVSAGFQFNSRAATASGNAFFYEGEYGNFIYFGTTGSNTQINNGIITAEEAWSVDSKIDDGKPGLGHLRTVMGTFRTECIAGDSTSATAARYDLGNENRGCALLFIY